MKAKISLQMFTVWSGPSLLDNRIMRYCRYNNKQKKHWSDNMGLRQILAYAVLIFPSGMMVVLAYCRYCIQTLVLQISIGRLVLEWLSKFHSWVSFLTELDVKVVKFYCCINMTGSAEGNMTDNKWAETWVKSPCVVCEQQSILCQLSALNYIQIHSFSTRL